MNNSAHSLRSSGSEHLSPSNGKLAKHAIESYSDLLIQTLWRLGSKVAFGSSGDAISMIHDSLSKVFREVTIAQHECSAAFLAIGYQTVCSENSVPVCFSTVSSRTPQLVTALACAHSEKIPLFVVTIDESLIQGNNPDISPYGKDITDIFEPVTAKSLLLKSVKNLEARIQHLYELALVTRTPVHLCVPITLISEPVKL